jgi:hypothetical protein
MTPPAPKAPAPSPTPPAAAPKVIPSTSDERVKNNVVRHEYRVLSDDEKKQMKAVKDAGLAFIELIDSMGSTRELSLAKTNAQQAVMWAVNHITR